MRCILIFDHLNDIIFSKYDRNFVSHINKIANSQGFDTSQFQYIGFLFVHLGFEDIKWLKRMLGICISVIKHICGPDIPSLKTVKSKSSLVKRLLDTWGTLVEDDQAELLEALEQLSVSNDLSSTAIKALKEATDKIKSKLDQSRSHALLFVENKFLALFSSRTARELSAGDLLFLSLLAECTRQEVNTVSVAGASQQKSSTDLSQSSDEFYSPQTSPEPSRKSEDNTISNDEMFSELILLSGNAYSAVTPYFVHITFIADSVSLVLLYQTNYDNLSIALNESFEAINIINSLSSSSTDVEGLKKGMELLEPSIKKLFDGIKKIKSSEISPKLDANIKVLHVKWDLLKRQWNENTSAACIGSCSHSLGLCLRDILQSTVLDKSNIVRGSSVAISVSQAVAVALANYTNFLQVKALRNFTLGSYPFHYSFILSSFIYETDSAAFFISNDIWEMVEFSRTHLQEGHLAIMWKDTAFNYAYYLWFEDMTGSPLKPKISPSVAVKSLPIPGVFSADFYQFSSNLSLSDNSFFYFLEELSSLKS
uniref:FUZ/MON1/HPS1 second Longin domain-containing protein n=1 Tax=Rhodnius prolixus TaxID=13249 RepID=T1HAF4_RHOPR